MRESGRQGERELGERHEAVSLFVRSCTKFALISMESLHNLVVRRVWEGERRERERERERE